VTWVWQAGGMASLGKPVVSPDDAKGLKIRGGSKEMDMMLKGAGAAITNVPSNEIYSAMQSGVLDAALTSSTSLITFRLYETGKNVTSARKNTFWFMFEPLVISKSVYDSLTKEQQQAIDQAGASLEKFALDAARSTTCGWRGLRQERRQGLRHGRCRLREVARNRAADRVGGFRQEREGRQALARHGDGRQVTPVPRRSAIPGALR